MKNGRSRGTTVFGNIHMFPQQVVHWPSSEKCLSPRLHNAHSTTGWLILSLDCVLMKISVIMWAVATKPINATCRSIQWFSWFMGTLTSSLKLLSVYQELRGFFTTAGVHPGRFRFRNSTRKSPNITALCIPFQPAAPFKYKKDSSIKVWAVFREVPDWMETSFLDIHA